jgi:CRP-like cAMP-binding protein
MPVSLSLKPHARPVRSNSASQMGASCRAPDYADMTGLRVETVVRTVKAMEQQGTLEIADGKILWHGR